MTFQDGETVGVYRIIGQLGQGGMATVYKAYHAGLDRYVAIKVLHPAFKEDGSFLGRFQREARVLAKLDHLNIVPIFDFAEHEGRPYLVMKYVEGETLKSRLAARPTQLADTLKVVEAVGAALAYAHQQGILHRDVKPSNIIVTSAGHHYLSDFGLARIASAGESTLSQDTLLGTPNYISPEQARGLTDLDGRTDIYSFGVVLYEMIVGRVPFSGDTPYSIIHDHIYSPLPPPSIVNPQVTEPLEMFLLKALAKERSDRFQDVPAMTAAFRQAARTGLAETPALHARAETRPPESQAPTATKAANLTATVRAQPTAASNGQVTLPGSRNAWKGWLIGAAVLLVVALAAAGTLLAGRLARQIRAGGAPTSLARETPAVEPTTAATPVSATGAAPADATLAANPNSPEAYMQLGRMYYDAGQFDKAAQACSQAAELQHYRALFYVNQIVAPYQSDPVFALTVLSDGLRHNTDRRLELELWALAGPLMEAVTPLPNAEPLLSQLSHDFPDRSGPLLSLARHYILLAEVNKAEPVLAQARKKFPDDPKTHFVSGEYLVAIGRLQEAATEFEWVIASRTAPLALRQAAQTHLDKLKGTATP